MLKLSSGRSAFFIQHLEYVAGAGDDCTGGDLCPEGGHRAQPGVSTLGALKINEFVLKEREADLIKLAPNAAPKITVRN
jgi:hypothetical protein